MPLTEILDMLGEKGLRTVGWQPAPAAKLNAEKRLARDRVNSFRQLYRDEFRGVLDVFASSIGDTIVYFSEISGRDIKTVTDAQRDAYALVLIALISAALEKYDLSQQLPTVHVMATLFAYVQWDRNRKYKDNDFADFGHAAAALAFCNGFATERSLGALVTQAGLDTLYGCQILLRPADITQWVERSRP